MIEPLTLIRFIPAAVAIVISPGPDTVYVLTQSIKNGRLAGLSAGLGTATGVLIHTMAAVLGLAALLRASAVAYTVVKYLGAVYLLYLCVRAFRNNEEFDVEINAREDDRSPFQAYTEAVVVNVSNPKVAVFVLAFFPQFIGSQANVTFQMTLLGVVYAFLSLSYLSGVTIFTAQVRRRLLNSACARRTIQYATGSVLLGFGAKLALEERPAP